jgi:hypothetical protein
VSITGGLANEGTIEFDPNDYSGGGSTLSIGGNLTNAGYLGVDDVHYAASGSTLSIGGALTNTGTLDIGAYQGGSPHSVSAKSLVNSGAVNLNYNPLNVSGATTNNGTISVLGLNFTEELAGAVGGKGSFSLNAANLQFDSSVSAGQTINEYDVDGADVTLTLEQAQNFGGTISGFRVSDTIDAANFLKSGTTFNFVEHSGGTGGTLTLHDGSLTANILMTGVYSNSDFTLAPDSGTGTLVKFV